MDSKSRSVSPPKEKSRSHARRDPKLNSRLVKCEKLLTELSKEEEAEYFREPVDIDKVLNLRSCCVSTINFPPLGMGGVGVLVSATGIYKMWEN